MKKGAVAVAWGTIGLSLSLALGISEELSGDGIGRVGPGAVVAGGVIYQT